MLCRVQGWNGGLAQREPSTELSPSLMQAPLSPLRSAVMQHAEESLNFDHISPISRNSSPSVSFSPQGAFSQEGINTLIFSQESERALHTPGGSHERSRSSRSSISVWSILNCSHSSLRHTLHCVLTPRTVLTFLL